MESLTVEKQQTSLEGCESPWLEITRVIRASRADIFAAWTNPEILHQWYGPGHMVVVRSSFDVREGGAYEIQMAGTFELPDNGIVDLGRKVTVHGVYRRVIPNQLLQFTWIPTWLPDTDTIVTISLREVEGGTELTLRHEQISEQSACTNYMRGWSGLLAKLFTHFDR
jgi:uncharacterized protein YndB with AHSA1/START domain